MIDKEVEWLLYGPRELVFASSSQALWLHFRPHCFSSGEGNGNPLQYCCLENPMDGGAWWAAVHGVAKSRTRLSNFTFTFHFSLSCIGEGNGNPPQCSCLENPRDGGAWWAAIYGVAQSWTRLKRLSSSSSFSSRFCLRAFAFHRHILCSVQAKNTNCENRLYVKVSRLTPLPQCPPLWTECVNSSYLIGLSIQGLNWVLRILLGTQSRSALIIHMLYLSCRLLWERSQIYLPNINYPKGTSVVSQVCLLVFP